MSGAACQASVMDALTLAQQCAHRMYADDKASQALGITISDVAPGAAVATMTIRDDKGDSRNISYKLRAP